MDVIYIWIKNIVIYMIVNTIVMNLLGNSSYKKYVSIASGMILVLIVVSPLMTLLKLDDNFDYFLNSNDFALATSNFKNELRYMEEKQSDAVISEYTARIKDKVAELLLEDQIYLNKFEVVFDKNVESNTFGKILSMNIKASYETQQASSSNLRSIDKINISKIDVSNQKEKDSKEIYSPMEIYAKNRLSDFYNMNPANINISIQGG